MPHLRWRVRKIQFGPDCHGIMRWRDAAFWWIDSEPVQDLPNILHHSRKVVLGL